MIHIPSAVRNEATVAGRPEWLAALPDIVAELRSFWRVEIGPTYPNSTEALVCEATRADGTPAVIKVMVPHADDRAEREAAVLRLADGAGSVRLLEFDRSHHALLLERLGPSVSDLDLPIRRRHQILCDTAAQFWRPLPGADLPTGAHQAQRLADLIVDLWERLDRPCSQRVIDHAITCAHRRRDAHDDERAMLVHGDVHQWNVLSADRETFKLVDPDGLFAEPEYDLGVIMREDPLELMQGPPDDRAHWLAARSGHDAAAIREWGIVERLSNALLCIESDLQPVGDQMLRAAEYVAIT